MVLFASPIQRRLILTLIVLTLFGQIILFSATAVMGMSRYGSEFYYVSRQLIGLMLGGISLFVVTQIPLKFWERSAYFLLALQIGLTLATFAPSLSLSTSLGASRWIRLGALSFQPSELAKVTVPIYLALSLSQAKLKHWSYPRWAAQLFPVVGLILLILKQPDLGAAALISFMIVSVLFVAGLRAKYLFGLGAVGTVLVGLAIMMSDYRKKRFLSYINPWSDPLGSGFQSIQSFLSFHSGKLFGVGLGNGNSKLFFLPDVHTDYIFSLVGEELGFLGSAIVLGLFLYLIFLLFRLSSQCETPFSRFLSFAIAIALSMQISVNLAGVTGVIPMKGLPLPFLSWGRSALMVNLVMIGMMLRCHREKSSEVIGSHSRPR